ncbi:class I SAM-dependent methyltransferase [Candidatus Uhrbacteria bacterium]|nr:class I SAM-dependent methyltransferase [Candidatus Uhrbacteria bacterium]
MSHLLVKDLGDEREATLHGRVFFDGRWHTDGVTFRTPYRKGTLDALFAAKGDYLYDEILRVDDPGYVQEQFLGFVRRQTDVAGKSVLDFGSGCGSSAIFLAREGAAVTSVELMPLYRQAARLRLRDEGLADRVGIVGEHDVGTLPFPRASFDLVTMSAVVEHIHPKDRRGLLHQLCAFLKPHGLLIITETPNRLWPYDGHTTRLPFTSWMPLTLACKAARILRPEEFGKKTNDELVYDGIVGGTWWGIRRLLPEDMRPALTRPLEEYRAYFKRLGERKRGPVALLVFLLRIMFFVLAICFSTWSRRVPINALFPYLNIAFEKTL